MRKRMFLGITAVFMVMAAGCGKAPAGEDSYSELDRYIVEKVKENYEDGTIEQENIRVELIYDGNFSQEDAEEIFVSCKILNLPHTAGLDKTVTLLLKKDTLEQIAYEEFSADDVVTAFFQTSAGQDKLLYIGTTIYQGISTQEVRFLEIQDGRWKEIPIADPEDFQDGYYCAVDGRAIIVSSTDEMTGPADIAAVLNWNPDTAQFDPMGQ